MSDFTTFKSQFKGDIITPTDTEYYQQAIARWAMNAKRNAEVVAFVKDAADVVLAIGYARAQVLPIAIRGGGHSPSGASSSEGGLVIDLSRYIASARVDPKARLVYVGGGALWETVDKAGIQHGLATVAGTVNHTGVGGLTLGGGYGWLGSEHGMVVDNLVQATVVTANGSIVTANEEENSDLFFGIRGGGCNFGVVTEFVYRLHPQRTTVYAGVLSFPPSALEKLIELTAAWWETAGKKEAMVQMLGIGPDGNPAIHVTLFYNGSEAEGRANFKAFHDLGPDVDQTKEIPYEELNMVQNFFAYHGQGVYMKGVAHKKPDYPTIAKTFEKVISASDSEFKVGALYEYFPLASSVPNDRAAFRRDPSPGVLLICFWKEDSEALTERGRAAVHELVPIVKGGHPEMTETEALGYSNYDNEAVTGEKDAVPDKAKLVFGEHYPRLQGIKKRYDPENIFNKWFPITPAFYVVCAPDADVTFVSSDNVLFHLHRKNLETNAAAFPPAEFDTRVEVVPLTEDAATLELLFEYVYPQRHSDLEDTPFATLQSLAEVAEKYEVFSLMVICKLRIKQIVAGHPVKIFNYAFKHGYNDILDLAVPYLLDIPLDEVAEGLATNLLAPWVRYRETWNRAAFKAIVTSNLLDSRYCLHCRTWVGKLQIKPEELWVSLGEKRSRMALDGLSSKSNCSHIDKAGLEDELRNVPGFEKFI